MRNAQRILVRKPVRLGRRWEDNISNSLQALHMFPHMRVLAARGRTAIYLKI
jgi:hypothetical protein